MRGRFDMRDQNGAALILVVIALPLMILLAAFATDVARWFVHKRHIQVVADAAALAGANQIRRDVEAGNSCVSSSAVGRATDYAGRNNTLGNAYPRDSNATVTTINGDPCADGFVKATAVDSNNKAFFNAATLPFDITARAKVSFYGLQSKVHLFPIAVPSDPTTATATFTNPDAGDAVVGQISLAKTGNDPVTGNPLFTGTASSPMTVDDHLDVKITLGTISPFANAAQVRGLRQTLDSAITNPPPIVTATNLIPSAVSCTSDPSTPYFFASGSNCTVGMAANVRWNGTIDVDNNGTVSAAETAAAGATGVYATVGGSNTKYPLALDPNDSTNRRWFVPDGIPVGAGLKGVPIHMQVEQQTGKVGGTQNNDRCPQNGANAACNVTVTQVQRPYNSDSDELARVDVGESGGTGLLAGLTSVDKGSSHTFTVTASFTTTLSLGAGIRPLRISGDNQTFAIGCQGSGNGHFTQWLATGCPTGFQKNALTRTPVCPTTLTPPDCVPGDPGGKLQSIDSGMTQRITVNGTCSPNVLKTGTPADIQDSDPRLITLALVPFDSFSDSGSSLSYPVLDFVNFYVTGWTDNQGHATTCGALTNQYPPNFVDGFFKAYLYGRYVQRLNVPNPEENPDPTTPCQFNTVYGCVAVLTE